IEAKEEAAARQVHATLIRIVSKSIPEPARTIRQSSIAFRDTSNVLKKRASALKDSRRILGRQPGTGGSNEGTGEILGPRVPDESIYADAEDDNEELNLILMIFTSTGLTCV
ncbi:hypothetical protein Tco_0460562, partial [Tanacetum coccineum]